MTRTPRSSCTNFLLRDAPIVFRRKLPTARAGACLVGLTVEVRIRADLGVFVLGVVEAPVGLSGRYAFGRVLWDRQPSPDFPATSLAMLAQDVSDVLHLFRMRLIDPAAWTSHPHALAQL